MSSSVNCLVQLCKWDVQFFRLQFCIVFHVRNKSNLSLQNTWETNTIAIFPSCQACLVWLYIVQCGAQVTFGSFVLWCLVNCLVQFCNVMFNSCGCILLLYTMWEINRIGCTKYMTNKYNCYISKLLSMLGLVNCLLFY